MSQSAENDALARLRSLRENYATRAEHWPEPRLAWADAVCDLDAILGVIPPAAGTEREAGR